MAVSPSSKECDVATLNVNVAKIGKRTTMQPRLQTELGSTKPEAVSEELRMFTSLPAELITLVAEKLDVCTLANFAAASTACKSAAEDLLLKALRKVERLRELLEPEPCARNRSLRSPPCFRLSRRKRAWLKAAYAFEDALQPLLQVVNTRMAWAVV